MSKKVSCLKDLLKKFGELKKLSPLPPVKEFNYLLMARGFVTSTHIIRVHCQNNRLEIANGIFRSLATKGSNVDSSFYTCMIIGLLKDDNVEEALRQMDNMEEKKIEPEDSAYYALFNWMCNNSRYKEAENLFFRMKKQPRVVLDIETYNGLFYVYLQTNEYEKADKLVKEMVELSIPITYRVVSFVWKKGSVVFKQSDVDDVGIQP
ncbi:Pentatricopeptide repeat-containing protein, mitochondrial [Artemisia annua]|uniref:Pentatricopeptide repeat-containing protein, mitochondrial n=1 Tax=Artemisia annua TaxID=35608 RepID=A0A2U1PMD1_ARTAN|nr:Pentatricopeptide repeat-containing protein, mitochondrial [Artemisia annua]